MEKISIFWDVTSYGLVYGYQHCGGSQLELPWRLRQQVPP